MSLVASRSTFAGSAAKVVVHSVIAAAASNACKRMIHARVRTSPPDRAAGAHASCADPCGGHVQREGADSMVMALPFLLGFAAAIFAWFGRRNTALVIAVLTVAIQVWWLVYHATDTLSIAL